MPPAAPAFSSPSEPSGYFRRSLSVRVADANPSGISRLPASFQSLSTSSFIRAEPAVARHPPTSVGMNSELPEIYREPTPVDVQNSVPAPKVNGKPSGLEVMPVKPRHLSTSVGELSGMCPARLSDRPRLLADGKLSRVGSEIAPVKPRHFSTSVGELSGMCPARLSDRSRLLADGKLSRVGSEIAPVKIRHLSTSVGELSGMCPAKLSDRPRLLADGKLSRIGSEITPVKAQDFPTLPGAQGRGEVINGHLHDLPPCSERRLVPVATENIVTPSQTEARGARRCFLVNVALERRGRDIHLLPGSHASPFTLKVEELAAPKAWTDGVINFRKLQLSLLGVNGATDKFTVTVSSEQLVMLADLLKSGTNRLIIDGKNLPALAKGKYPSLCAAGRQSVVDVHPFASLPASEQALIPIESIPTHIPMLASSPPASATKSEVVVKSKSYTGFKRFASEPDLHALSQKSVVDQSQLIVPRLPDCAVSLDGSVRLGSLNQVASFDDEPEADWELLEPFEQHLKQKNQDLGLHEHLVHKLAYNLEGKNRVTLPDGQCCTVEKVAGVPAGLNAYFLVPETVQVSDETEIRLIFRGTKDRASVVRDLESSGAGFETMEIAASTIARQLLVILASLSDHGRGVNVVIGGHSLGGADAQNFLAYLLGLLAAEASGAEPTSPLDSITNITLFTKCSAGVPKLAHERVCSALQQFEGGSVRVKIFHLKVAGDVVQATGDCHIGAGLPFAAADVSVLQVHPANEASRIDRHTKKYFTDDTNLAPVYWYNWMHNKSEQGTAEISRSLQNTSAVLRYRAVKTMQWALHCAAWYFIPDKPVTTKPAPTVANDSWSDICSEKEIKAVYDRIIAQCLGLSNRPLGTPWKKINPYGPSAPNSAVALKPHYLKNLLQDDAAFGAGAEFQNLVNQVNTNVLTIREPEVVRRLLVKIGIGGGVCNDPNVSFKGLVVKDALWPVTAHYCELFFEAAAKQYAAEGVAHKRRVNSPIYTFDLLLRLQAFNARFSKLERDVDKVNFVAKGSVLQRSEVLADLNQRAANLQQEVGPLYQQCKEHRLSDKKTAFILGQPDSCANGLISKKVARFQRSIEKELHKCADC